MEISSVGSNRLIIYYGSARSNIHGRAELVGKVGEYKGSSVSENTEVLRTKIGQTNDTLASR